MNYAEWYDTFVESTSYGDDADTPTVHATILKVPTSSHTSLAVWQISNARNDKLMQAEAEAEAEAEAAEQDEHPSDGNESGESDDEQNDE